MPLLSTAEAEAYFLERGVDTTDHKVRELGKKQRIKCYQIKGIGNFYPLKSIDDYFLEVGIPDDSTLNSPKGTGKKSRLGNFFRALRIRRNKIFRKLRIYEYSLPIAATLFLICMAVLFALFAIWLEIKNIPGSYAHLSTMVAMLFVSAAITVILRAFLEELSESKIKTVLISVEGVTAVFFGIFFLLNYYDPIQKELVDLEAKYNDLEQENRGNIEEVSGLQKANAAHDRYANNLPEMFAKEGVQVPMNLKLKIACFGEGRPLSFNYIHNRQVISQEEQATVIGSSDGDTANLGMPLSNGQFIIYKGDNPTENMVAPVEFDNSKVLNPEISVNVSGKSLCENHVQDSITAAELENNIISLSRSGDRFIEHNRKLFNIVNRINATNASLLESDIEEQSRLGDLLVSNATSESPETRKIALDILGSLSGRWVSSDFQGSKAELEKVKPVLDPALPKTEDQDIADRRLVARIDNIVDSLERTDLSCRLSDVSEVDSLDSYLDCLSNIAERKQTKAVRFKIEVTKIRIALFDNNADTHTNLSNAAQKLIEIGDEMKDQLPLSQTNEVATRRGATSTSLASDAFVISGLAYMLANEPRTAYDVLGRALPAIDNTVDLTIFQYLSSNFASSGINVQLATDVLRTAISSVPPQSFADPDIQVREMAVRNAVASQFTLGYQIFVHARVNTEAEAEELASDIHAKVASSNPDLLRQHPALDADHTFGVAAAKSMQNDTTHFDVQIAPTTAVQSFSLIEACQIRSKLETIVNYEMKVAGPGSSLCTV